jgi:hypothetical protein
MNYTLEHLKIAYNAGAKKFPFDQTLELISLLGQEGLQGLLAQPRGADKSEMLLSTLSPSLRRAKHPGAPLPIRKNSKHRGALATRIFEFLRSKGNTGAHVKDIAESIQAHQSSVTVWFYSTGKKYLKSGEIKKVAPSTFSFCPSPHTLS